MGTPSDARYARPTPTLSARLIDRRNLEASPGATRAEGRVVPVLPGKPDDCSVLLRPLRGIPRCVAVIWEPERGAIIARASSTPRATAPRTGPTSALRRVQLRNVREIKIGSVGWMWSVSADPGDVRASVLRGRIPSKTAIVKRRAAPSAPSAPRAMG